MYLVGEGVLGCFKDALLCGERFNPHELRVASSSRDDEASLGEDPLHESAVMGPSGEGYDCVVPSSRLPLLKPGDWLYFTQMGAYTASIASANSAVYRVDSRAFVYVATSFRA